MENNMKDILVLDELISQTRDRHLSAQTRKLIFGELQTLNDLENEDYSLKRYILNHNGKPMNGAERIFKYQLSDGDRLLYTFGKYVDFISEEHRDSLVLIRRSKHDEQGEDAKVFSFHKKQGYTQLSELAKQLKDSGLDKEGFSETDLETVADIMAPSDITKWHTFYVLRENEDEDRSDKDPEVCLIPQQAEIISKFIDGDNPIAVFGGAGTGKTLIAIHTLADYHKSDPDCLALYFTQSFELIGRSKRLFRTLDIEDERVEFYNITDFCLDHLGKNEKAYISCDGFLSFIKGRKDLTALCKKERLSPVEVWTEIRGTLKGAMSQKWTHNRKYVSQEKFGNVEKAVREGWLIRSPKDKKLFGLSEKAVENGVKNLRGKISEGIIDYFSSFDPDLRTLERDDYFSMPDENATLGAEKRSTVWKICEEYEKYLKENELFDDNDLIREMFRFGKKYGLPSADLIVVDEIQDYTELQIYLLFEMAADKSRIAMFGDNHQNVNPTYFSVSRLESLFYLNGNGKSLQTPLLSINHRCPGNVITRTNALSELRRNKIAKMSDDLEQPELARNKAGALVSRLKYSENNLRSLLEETVKYPGAAILVPDEKTKEYAKSLIPNYERLGINYIFTVPEVKGMEYSYVVAFDLIGEHSEVWNEIMTSEKARKQTKYRYYFNLLYVAMSRTMLHLCFIDKKSADILDSVLAPSVFDSFNAEDLRFSDLIQTDEEWIGYGKSCEENGRYQDAIGAYIKGHAPEKDVFRCRMYVAYKEKDYESAMRFCILSDSSEFGERIVGLLDGGDAKEIGRLYVALSRGRFEITESGPAFHLKALFKDESEKAAASKVLLSHYGKVTGTITKGLQKSTEKNEISKRRGKMSNISDLDLDELLRMYDDLLEKLIELNDEYPSIKKAYEDSKALIEAQRAEIGAQMKIIEAQKQTISKLQERIEGSEKRIDEKLLRADTQSKRLENAAAQSEAKSKRLENAAEQAESATESLGKLVREVRETLTPESLKSNRQQPDYSFVGSVNELYSRYGSPNKVMVIYKSVEKSWTGDYCFAVEKIVNGTVFGTYFKHGEPYEGKNRKIEADEKIFSIYNGPSLNKITEYYNSRVSPPEDLPF